MKIILPNDADRAADWTPQYTDQWEAVNPLFRNRVQDNYPMNTPKTRCSDLMDLVERLRGENGCPWDRRQTAETMAPHLTEETYELVEAIFAGSPEDVREELGDVLFHIHFIVHLYRETGHFDMADVVAEIVEKMTRRHPHVFGDAHVATADDVKDQWHRIKREEKKGGSEGSRCVSVPAGLPALMRAYRIADRAARTGAGDGQTPDRVAAVEGRWASLKSAFSHGDQGRISAALGEMFMELVHMARAADVHPEPALAEAARRCQQQFEAVERPVADKTRNRDPGRR